MGVINALRVNTRKLVALFKLNVIALTSFIGFNADALIAFAGQGDGKGGGTKGGDGVSNFTKYTGGPGKMDTLTNIFAGFIPPLQGLGAVLLIIFAIICGIRIGMSAVTSDARSREGSIVGLFFIIVAGVVVIHAKSIVGMSAGLTGV